MTKITVDVLITAPVDHAWMVWTTPAYIMKWNSANDDWHCPAAKNDLRVGGRFTATMAAKDGSMSFDFSGTYSEVIPNQRIAYSMEDGRTVEVTFEALGNQTKITEIFDPETTHPVEFQKHERSIQGK